MAPPLRRRHVPAPDRAARGLQPDHGRDRRLPGRGRPRLRAHAAGRRGVRRDQGARLPVLAAAGHRHRRRGHGAEAGQEGAERPAAGAVARGVPAPLAREGRRARTSSWSTGPAAATATTTRRGSSTRRWASSSACGRAARHRGGDPGRDAERDPTASSARSTAASCRRRWSTGPRACSRSRTSTRRRTSTCSSSPSGTSRPSATSASCPPTRTKRMLDFVAETAKDGGLDEYRLMIFCGAGRRPDRLPPALARARRPFRGMPA